MNFQSLKSIYFRKYHFILILPIVFTALLLVVSSLWRIDASVKIALEVSKVSFVVGGARKSIMFNPVSTNSLTLINFKEINLGEGLLELEASSGNMSSNATKQLNMKGRIFIVSTNPFSQVTLKNVSLNRLNISRGTAMELSMSEKELKLQSRATGKIRKGKTILLSCSDCRIKGTDAQNDVNGKWLRFTSERERLIHFYGPKDDDMKLTFEMPLDMEQNQWYLEPAEISEIFTRTSFVDDFVECSHNYHL